MAHSEEVGLIVKSVLTLSAEPPGALTGCCRYRNNYMELNSLWGNSPSL